MPTLIRPARQEDAAAIAAFNQAMALETEGKRLDPARVRPGVERMLADPALGFYLIAECDGRTAGVLMVTYEWSDWRNARFWWIQSVYIAPEHRRKGVFRALYDAVRNRAMQDPEVCALRLYVEHANRAAQATYRALGMHDTGYLVFEEGRPGVDYFGGASPALD
jgi:ribosomal protein S18 acetylase RimI-like enzyme